MDSEETARGRSPTRPSSVVPQIPAEYDDLYMHRGSYANQRDFSSDINKKMNMPDRLSVDGKNLHDLEVENMRAQSNPHSMSAAGMAIPDKITLSGAGHRDVLEDQFGYFNGSVPENKGYVNITTPPRVLTVDERFPVIQDEPETADNSMAELTSQSLREAELSPYRKPSHTAVAINGAGDSVIVMEQRLSQLESQEQSRQTKEMILYPSLAFYFLYKLYSWLRS